MLFVSSTGCLSFNLKINGGVISWQISSDGLL